MQADEDHGITAAERVSHDIRGFDHQPPLDVGCAQRRRARDLG
jgi:hypothetical protein